ncbi:GyrI-like domain-containing protein [Inquilinus sp. KBS0705]|nr:GyrI-like domain-containing protein [Inquilinus sp. KBS0705]
MQPRIETLAGKKFIGKHISMCFADNKTFELWRSFMPRRKEIADTVGTNLYSIEVYPPLFFNAFNPKATFEKWAAVEVTALDNIPEGMDSITLPAGMYAVFIHKGRASDGPATYSYIFNNWLPHSNYVLDDRPHFAVMGDKYKNDDPLSEEELWIPVENK